MNQEYALTISTALKEPKKFLVDGEEFIIKGIDHLTPELEAEVMALFSRLNIVTEELSAEANVTRGKAKATEVQETRLTLLTKMTTLDKDTARKIPLSQQVLLLDAIQAEVTEDSGIEEMDKATEAERKTPGQIAAEEIAAQSAAERAAEG